MFQKLIKTTESKITILIGLVVGSVFLSERMQKFLFSDRLEAGRFAKIGLPTPGFLGGFVEMLCGALILNCPFYTFSKYSNNYAYCNGYNKN